METPTNRLDHMIREVADIRSEHASLLARGFHEAWPIGPFWPGALTSGIHVGDLNLELYQPLDRAPSVPAIKTLVFEPTSIAAVATVMASLGLAYEVRDKIEADPELLRLRGFSGERTERICTNLLPLDPPIPFFFCEYAPFLRERLEPRRYETRNPIRKIVYGIPRTAREVVDRIGLRSPILEFIDAEVAGVLRTDPPIGG